MSIFVSFSFYRSSCFIIIGTKLFQFLITILTKEFLQTTNSFQIHPQLKHATGHATFRCQRKRNTYFAQYIPKIPAANLYHLNYVERRKSRMSTLTWPTLQTCGIFWRSANIPRGRGPVPFPSFPDESLTVGLEKIEKATSVWQRPWAESKVLQWPVIESWPRFPTNLLYLNPPRPLP